jgi:hypothetical protein
VSWGRPLLVDRETGAGKTVQKEGRVFVVIVSDELVGGDGSCCFKSQDLLHTLSSGDAVGKRFTCLHSDELRPWQRG